MAKTKAAPGYANEYFGLEPHRVCVEVKEKEPFRLLCIPDTHFPFVHDSRLKAVYEFTKKFKPTHIVQLGDLHDQYCFSSFTKSIDFITPENEILQSEYMAAKMWDTFNKIVPKAYKFQLWGNHDQRVISRLYEKAAEFATLLKGRDGQSALDRLYKFPKVTTVGPYKSEVRIRVRTNDDQEYHDIYLLHGIFTGNNSHIRRFGDTVIRAHSHKQSLVPQKFTSGKEIFELDCGCILDPGKLVFRYATTQDPGWIPGFGYVEKDEQGLLQRHLKVLK
jgi:hypothetical protein